MEEFPFVLTFFPRTINLTSIEAFDSRRADPYTIEGRFHKTIRRVAVFFVRFLRDPLQALINPNECVRGRYLT